MILLTTLRGDPFGLNPDLVEEIRANGANCVITLVSGRTHTAAEDLHTVRTSLVDYRVDLLRAAATEPEPEFDLYEDAAPTPVRLTPVPDSTPVPDEEHPWTR